MKVFLFTKKNLNILIFLSLISLLVACKTDNRTVPSVIAEKQTFDYQKHIKPILENKCIACHACYDAPCQLKMQSEQGVDRGASKLPVYDGTRLNDSVPTRLYVDAQSTNEWRDMGFFSVLEQRLKPDDKNKNYSLLKNMIDLAQKNPLPKDKAIPESIKLGLLRKNTCPAPGEFSDYANNNPHGGMPFAVSGLSVKEASKISTWLNEGAKFNLKETAISPADKVQIKDWEIWLNSQDKRTALVARYIYEHLFLGHLYLEDIIGKKNSNSDEVQFYTLVRSYTPSGQAVIPVKTVRPFDDPKKLFYYRLKRIEETIVHKTHITYRFDQKRLQHYKQIFLKPKWSLESLPGYSYVEKSNPFITYKAMPAKIRYRFMLDDAEFFVRNFIRGPVCRGQIATNVIRDQFWVMFENPEYEVYTNNDEYQNFVNSYLGLPGEKTSIIDLGSEWFKYSDKRNKYLDVRQSEYQKVYPEGATLEHIWNGDKTNENAFLSIFRHHDSASVTKGWLGEIPLTSWFMDYPLFERTYYELVASFDVFGNVSHQAQTRLYFDLIRNGSEVNFLRLLPAASRSSYYDNWYQSAAKLKTEITYHELNDSSPSAINFATKDSYKEILQSLLNRYPQLTQSADKINRCSGNCSETNKVEGKQNNNEDNLTDSINSKLARLAATPASKLTGIKWLPEVSFISIELPDKSHKVYSVLRNRRHSSVSFILGESLRYQEQKDTLTILPKLIGSYPNLMIKLVLSDLESFVSSFEKIATENEFEVLIEKWGVRRMNPDFWNTLHGFSQQMHLKQPLESGVYDINRYGRW